MKPIWKKLKQLWWWQNSLEVKSIGKFLNSRGHVTPKWIIRFRPKSNLIEILSLSLLTARMKLIRKKLKPLQWWENFSHVKSMGAICCHGNQSTKPICLKTLCSLSHYLIMVSQEIWSRSPHFFQRYTSLKVWTTTDDDGPYILIPHWSRRLRWAKNAIFWFNNQK